MPLLAPRERTRNVVNAMHRAAWSTILLLLLALAREAGAQQAPPPDAHAPASPRVFLPSPRVSVFTSLTYERKPGAEVCPEEGALRSELLRRLGYDPFVPNPEGIAVGDIRVVVTKDRRGFDARYAWTGSSDVQNPAGSAGGPGRTRRDCYDVLSDVAVELAFYFAILEIEYGKKFAPKPPAPVCPSTEAAAAPEPPPCRESRFSVWPTEWPLPPLEKPELKGPEPPERWPSAIRLRAAVGPEVFATGWGSLGLSAEIGARYRAISFGFEVHGDPPLGPQPLEGVGVSFARVTGALLLCGHFGWFTGCGVGEAGRVLFPDHIAALPPSTSYSAVGVRTGLDFPVAPPRLFLHTAVDVLAPIHPARYADGGRTLFQVASPSAGLGLGLLLELPP